MPWKEVKGTETSTDEQFLSVVAALYPTKVEAVLGRAALELWTLGEWLISKGWYRGARWADRAGDVPDTLEVWIRRGRVRRQLRRNRASSR